MMNSPFLHKQAAKQVWAAKNHHEEWEKDNSEEEETDYKEEGEKDGEREIKAWQQTLPPPPHPIEGSYVQVIG